MNKGLTEKQKSYLSICLHKNYRKLVVPIDELTREQASGLIIHFEKGYVLKKGLEELIEPITVKEYEEFKHKLEPKRKPEKINSSDKKDSSPAASLLTASEVARLLQPISNRYKIIDRDIVKNAAMIYKMDVSEGYSIQDVEFLKGKLKEWGEFEKALYHIDKDKYSLFCDKDEYKEKMKAWGLPLINKHFTWKKYNECSIIGYDQYNRAILRLKPETELLKAVNIQWLKSLNT